MAARPAIRLAGVSKRYPMTMGKGRLHSLKGALLRGELWRQRQADRGFPALTDVDLEVWPGEAVGVIGPNGSGKSTLLKLAARILSPTVGTVEVHGRVTALIELGAGFHPEITGRENAVINGMMLGLSRAEVTDLLPEIAAFAGIGSFLDEPVKRYSSGMYVRLGFAVAVAARPDVLIVDEVLAVGDEAFGHRCLERISALQRSGTAILLVSHDLDLVERIAHRALYLREGSVAMAGPAGAVVARYRSDVAGEEQGTPAPAPTPDQRWGNRAVVLDLVELVDHEGRAATSVEWGQPAGIRLCYTVYEAQTDFVFGVAIHREDGSLALGTNTLIDGWRPRLLEGSGEVTLEFPSLELGAGRYHLDAAVHRQAGLAYDYIRDALSFSVVCPRPWQGSAAVRHRWRPRGPSLESAGDT